MKKIDISFCIITDGNEPEKLTALIESIKVDLDCNPSIDYEIIVAGDLPPGEYIIDDWLPMEDAARAGLLGKLRNAACRASRGNILVVLDDDMVIMPGFVYEAILGLSQAMIICPNVTNPDGSRFWGWATCINGVSKLSDWEQPDSGDNYITGGVCIMRRSVFEAVQWDETIGFYKGEDIIFSAALHRAGYRFAPAKSCNVIHNAPYTQKGWGVYRL